MYVLWGLGIAAAVLLLDQASKYWILNDVLAERSFIIYTSFFNLVKAWNTGVSFSMFNDWGWVGILVLSLLALTIVGFLFNWLRHEKNRYMQTALGMIIGGALGNVIDRVRLGAVFDFLDFHIGVHHWPAFNVADSFICIGAVMIIVYNIAVKTEKEEKK